MLNAKRCAGLPPSAEYNPGAIKRPTNNAAIGLVKAAERNLSRSRSDRILFPPVSLPLAFSYLALAASLSFFFCLDPTDLERPPRRFIRRPTPRLPLDYRAQ